MSAAASIKVTKSFSYKGATRLWSNRYHFTDGAPADNTKWTTFSDAVVNAEKAVLPSATGPVTIVQTLGYDAGSDIPVFSKTYAQLGTFSPAANPMAPGDAALLVRYATATRTSKNHPLYLFNYYHGIATNGTSSQDFPMATQKTAFQTYAANWITGFSDGVVSHHRCGPNGDVATGSLVGTHITHRDFPRD